MYVSAMYSATSYAGSNSIVLARPSKDTTVRSDLLVRANDNYGLQKTILVGGNRGGLTGANDAIRSLIQFDTWPFVNNKNFTKATLKLTVGWMNGQSGQNFKITAHRITGPWTEGNGSEELPPIAGAVWTDDAFGVAWSGHHWMGSSGFLMHWFLAQPGNYHKKRLAI